MILKGTAVKSDNMIENIDKSIRRKQTDGEFADIEQKTSGWYARRCGAENYSEHKTQIEAVRELITTSICQLKIIFNKEISSLENIGEYYTVCKNTEMVILWLKRIFEFFQQKFDQRDDEETGKLLEAADEVVWSCYNLIYLGCNSLPPPLPYIEPWYSPEALPIDIIPKIFRDGAIETEQALKIYKEHFNKLPIPIVRMPPVCIRTPWYLILLGHEVGHHIQYSLLPKRELVTKFKDQFNSAMGESGEKWKKWSEEIFADALSILYMREWAIKAMSQLELAPEVSMIKERDYYPSPIVRLHLMAEFAESIGLNGRSSLPPAYKNSNLTKSLCNEEILKCAQIVNDFFNKKQFKLDRANGANGADGAEGAEFSLLDRINFNDDFIKIIKDNKRVIKDEKNERILEGLDMNPITLICSTYDVWFEEENSNNLERIAEKSKKLIKGCAIKGFRKIGLINDLDIYKITNEVAKDITSDLLGMAKTNK